MEIRGIVQGGQINLPNTTAEDSSLVNNGVEGLNDIGVLENNNNNIIAEVNAPRISEKEIQDALVKMNRFLQDNKTHAEYTVHDKLKTVVMIRIVDDKTGDIIKEIPPKKIVDMVAKMCEMIGVLVDEKA